MCLFLRGQPRGYSNNQRFVFLNPIQTATTPPTHQPAGKQGALWRPSSSRVLLLLQSSPRLQPVKHQPPLISPVHWEQKVFILLLLRPGEDFFLSFFFLPRHFLSTSVSFICRMKKTERLSVSARGVNEMEEEVATVSALCLHRAEPWLAEAAAEGRKFCQLETIDVFVAGAKLPLTQSRQLLAAGSCSSDFRRWHLEKKKRGKKNTKKQKGCFYFSASWE